MWLERSFTMVQIFAFPTPALPGSGSKGRPIRTLSQHGSPSTMFDHNTARLR